MPTEQQPPASEGEHREESAADAALFARLRSAWRTVDPVPADLVDRMVAAVAVEDLHREYEQLTLVEAERAAVRGDAQTLTIQFTDGSTTVLLHMSATDDGRRVDGWVDATALAIKLVQGDREWTTQTGERGRFSFEQVAPGMSRLVMVVRDSSGRLRDLQTPAFEI